MMRKVLILLLGFAGLSAADVVDSNTIAYNVNGTENDMFTQFNAALGTLNSVTLFYFGSMIYLEPFVTLGETATPAFAYANFESGFDLTLPDIPTFSEFLSLTENDFGCSSSTGEFSNCSAMQLFQTGPLAGSMLLSPSSLNPYIGAGTLVSQLVSEDGISGENSSNPGETMLGLSRVTSGNYYLEYNYTPASADTPEPGPLAMIGMGLTLLGISFRRLLKTPAQRG